MIWETERGWYILGIIDEDVLRQKVGTFFLSNLNYLKGRGKKGSLLKDVLGIQTHTHTHTHTLYVDTKKSRSKPRVCAGRRPGRWWAGRWGWGRRRRGHEQHSGYIQASPHRWTEPSPAQETKRHQQGSLDCKTPRLKNSTHEFTITSKILKWTQALDSFLWILDFAQFSILCCFMSERASEAPVLNLIHCADQRLHHQLYRQLLRWNAGV